MDKKKYFIWGTGNIAEELNQLYAEQLMDIELVGYIDNDLQKEGNIFFGKKVYLPSVLLQYRDCYIIIGNSYIDEIRFQIMKDYPWLKDRIISVYFFRKLQLITRYKNCEDVEIKEILNFLEDRDLRVFNYPFVDLYEKQNYKIEYDSDKGLFYTYYFNKKMYFSRAFKEKEKVKGYYQSICIEQDMDSPHRYLTDTFAVPENAIVVDAGVGEGNFALSIIDYVKRIYLFEPDDGWIEALKYTFEPYKDKVVIINKSVSNYIAGKTTTIDKEIEEEQIDFLKMDVEGEEVYALEGTRRLISNSKHMKCVICTYHQEFAYEIIRQFLISQQFNIETSKGYMWFFLDSYNGMRAPILRRGLIRAEKIEN